MLHGRNPGAPGGGPGAATSTGGRPAVHGR